MKSTLITIIRSIASVVLGYMLYALVNMGLVLLLFGSPSTSPFLVVISLLLIIPVSSFYLTKVIAWIASIKKQIHVLVALVLVAIVTLINMYMAVSLEPFYYKVIYLILLIVGTLAGISKLRK